MSEIHNAPRVHSTPLGQDFGQSPIGKLGGRTVQQVEPGPPRTIGQALSSFLSDIKSLGTRLLDMVTPHGVRSEGKYRRGLEAVSSQVGDLLGTLSKTRDHKVDGITAKRIIESLPGVSGPVLSRGTDYTELVSERVGVHVRNMTPAQLVALRDGVAMAQASAMKDDRELSGHLDIIAKSVRGELTQRLRDGAVKEMQPILEQAIAQVKREGEHPGAVAYVYNTLLGVAGKLLDEHGVPDQPGDMRRALIKDTISTLIDDNKLPMGDLGSMMMALPSSELRALAQSSGQVKEVPFTAERLVSGAIGLRAQDSEEGFLESSARVLAGDGNLVGNLVETGKFLEDLRRHSEVNELEVDPRVDLSLAKLHSQLEETLSPSRLPLGGLDDTQLLQLSKAIRTIGIERPVAQIDAEIARRKSEVRLEYTNSLREAIGAGKRGDLGKMLEGLVGAKEKAIEALEMHCRLGQRIDDADKIMQFREDLTLQALGTLPQEDLMALFGMLNSRDGTTLVGALAEAAFELLPTGRNPQGKDPELGKRLFDVGTDLQILNLCVKQVLGQQGVSLPPLPDQTEYGMSDLSPGARGAIEQAFGVTVSDDLGVNVLGVAGPGMQGAFEENLRDVEQVGSGQKLPGGEGTGVSDVFWRDLGRAGYSITSDGVSRAIVEQEGFSTLDESSQTAKRLAGIEELRKLCRGDEELLMLVSQCANQSTLAGLELGLMSESSPIRLPDGTPVRMVGKGHTTYSFSGDPDGNVRLRIDYSVSGATRYFNPKDGSEGDLDPARSHSHFTVELTISRDRQVSVSDPIQFFFDIRKAQA